MTCSQVRGQLFGMRPHDRAGVDHPGRLRVVERAPAGTFAAREGGPRRSHRGRDGGEFGIRLRPKHFLRPVAPPGCRMSARRRHRGKRPARRQTRALRERTRTDTSDRSGPGRDSPRACGTASRNGAFRRAARAARRRERRGRPRRCPRSCRGPDRGRSSPLAGLSGCPRTPFYQRTVFLSTNTGPPRGAREARRAGRLISQLVRAYRRRSSRPPTDERNEPRPRSRGRG